MLHPDRPIADALTLLTGIVTGIGSPIRRTLSVLPHQAIAPPRVLSLSPSALPLPTFLDDHHSMQEQCLTPNGSGCGERYGLLRQVVAVSIFLSAHYASGCTDLEVSLVGCMPAKAGRGEVGRIVGPTNGTRESHSREWMKCARDDPPLEPVETKGFRRRGPVAPGMRTDPSPRPTCDSFCRRREVAEYPYLP